MPGRSVEDRLRQFGTDLDMLAARRAEEKSVSLVELVDLQARRPPKRRARVFVAAAVVALLTVLAALVIRSIGTSPPASEAPSWERLDSPSVGLPRRVNGGVSGTVRQQFIVTGTRAVWSSTDGTGWQRRPLPNIDPEANVTGLATANGRALVWTITTSRGAPQQLWSSHDGVTWREVTPVGLESFGGLLSFTGHGRTFIATGMVFNADRTITGKVWTSHDGVHWTSGTLVDGANQALAGPVWFDGRFIAQGVTGYVAGDSFSVWESADGSTWTQTGQVDIPRLGAFYAPPGSRHLYGIQFETALTSPEPHAGAFGGRLMTSLDGIAWTEIRSFHNQLPVANPDHILRTHGWWILSGNTGTPNGQRRADIWWSQDLAHWNELPKPLQGAPNSGTGVPTAATRQTVIGTALYVDHALWRWQP